MQHIWQRSLWHNGTLHFSFSYSSSQNLAVAWIGSKGFAQLLKASNSSGSSALSHYSIHTYFSDTIFLAKNKKNTKSAFTTKNTKIFSTFFSNLFLTSKHFTTEILSFLWSFRFNTFWIIYIVIIFERLKSSAWLLNSGFFWYCYNFWFNKHIFIIFFFLFRFCFQFFFKLICTYHINSKIIKCAFINFTSKSF